MSARSTLSDRAERAMDPRNLLSSIGEVAYGWDIVADELSWGPNVRDVLGELPAAALVQGLAFAGLVEPGSGRSRYDAILAAEGEDRGEGLPYRTRYVVTLANGPTHVEDTGRWFAGNDGRPATARGVLRIERAGDASPLRDGEGSCDRAALVGHVAAALAEHLPAERGVVVLVAAIDELARLNDDFGHEATDEIIAVVQERLRAVMRRRDMVLRYSSNRFAILLSGCPVAQIEAAASRFAREVSRAAIETSHGIALARLRIGAAVAPDLSRQAGSLVAAAEAALIEAKAMAADKVVIARQPGRPSAGSAPQPGLDVLAIAALNERRISLALQPVVDARTRRLVFSEALLRVGRAQGGFLAPAELVPLLERRGLVHLFDHRVLELALDLLSESPTRQLSINVSPRSLTDPEWFAGFLACMRAAPRSASRLIVELTETATIVDPARIAKLLETIRDQGTRIAIDDFGAGHTSLRHLRAFPIDLLKLDGTFTQNLQRSTDDRFYVRTLIDLAQHLRVDTVAEWVDSEVQAAMLRDWGVTYLQGHLIGEARVPAPPAADSTPERRRRWA